MAQADSQDFINEKYYQFEKQHPEYSIDDIVNPDVMLPEDSQFAQILNPVKKKLQIEKNLVTIEQTSASLFRCRYSYVEGRGYKLTYL